MRTPLVSSAGGSDLPSGRLVFFFSDVEGSTRLLTALGDEFVPLLGEHQHIVRSSLAAHGGIEVSTEGDSFFAVFRSAADAVAAAADTQRALARYQWPTTQEFRVRIGLHVGQAILAGDNYVGIDVNRAARIANAGNGGQVVLSDETAGDVAGKLPSGVQLADLGRHRLRDIGVIRLWQLAIDGAELPNRALRTLEAHPSNLPIETTSLVDREEETRTLQQLIRETRLVTVSGAGGIGKSRLAVHAARSVVAEYPDGVFYLDLLPLDRVETVVDELVSLLGIRVTPGGDPSDALVEQLRDRRALLLLETADRHPGLATLVARLSESCDLLRILVTSRSALNLRVEREVVVRPLGLPTAKQTLSSAAETPAVELFVRRAQAANPAFRLSDENLGQVVDIVTRLDGIPLALELAAGAARLLSPSGILARLAKSLPLPSGAAVDLPERQRTLNDTISWSYQLLEPSEQVMLQRLSAFAADFDLDGAAAVAMDEHGAAQDGDDGLEILGRLVGSSLVVRVESPTDDRFRLLGMIREFAATELAASGTADSTRSRHARYWLEVARREATMVDGPQELDALASLERGDDEFRAALEWASGAADADHLALHLANALARSWYLRGRVHEGAMWLDRALSAAPGAPAPARAAALHWLGVMYEEQRESPRAIHYLEEALAIQREIGDERAVARELNSLGAVHRNNGGQDAAATLLGESLMLRRGQADSAGLATVLTNLGILAIDRADLERAIELLQEAHQIDRASGATGGAAYSSISLGTALLRSGRRAQAVALIRSALTGFHELGDTDGVAESLEALGEAALPHAPARAARLLLAATSIRERERIALRPIDRSVFDQTLATAAAALSTDELASARADATGMDLGAAVAYALADTGTSP